MYISRDDITAAISPIELVQLTNDEMSDYATAQTDWAVVDRAITYACELADGYLTGRYSLPLADPPSLLRQFCGDLARYWLHKRRLHGAEMPKGVQMAYDDATKMLGLVRDGKLHLGIRGQAEATEQLQPEKGAYRVRGNPRQDWSGY